MIDAKFASYLPLKCEHVHKFSRGEACIIGGSSKFPGSIMMSAKSAARSGAGYVSMFVPSKIAKMCQAALLPIVTCPLPSTSVGCIGKKAYSAINLTKQDCALFGPGVCIGKTQTHLLKKIISQDILLVIDADGISNLKNLETKIKPKDIYSRRKPLVITPHAGELKKWLGCDSEIDLNKLDKNNLATLVQEKIKLVSAENLIVVAKGEKTIVVTQSSFLEPACGTQTLATAGTGDVLSGCITGLMSQIKPNTTEEVAKICAAAVEVHALAGKIAGKEFGVRGAMATDVCENIGIATDALLENVKNNSL